MDLEYVVDIVPPALKDFYTLKDGKYHLNVKEHPKTSEFRENNIKLTQKVTDLETRFKDIDPAVVITERAELTELRKGSPRLTELEAENARLKASTAEAQANADRIRLRAALTTKAAAAGVRENALEMAVNELAESFVIEGQNLKAKPGLFSPNTPGAPLSPEDSLMVLSRDKGFLFKPSGGSGSGGHGSGGGTGDGVKVIRNPSSRDLGRYASDVAAGRVRFEHDD
jgi:hypothetical protein